MASCQLRSNIIQRYLWLAILGLCSLITPAYSQAAERDSTRWPFSSIGRINVVTGGNSTAHCTGTLIGPRHVLTAAHCLFNPMRDHWAHPSSVHFLAGYSRGEYKAHSRAIAYVKGAVDVFTFPIRPASAAEDWVIIELSEAMSLKPIEILSAASPINDSTHIIRAGYRYDRAHVLTVQQDCWVQIITVPAGLMLDSCGAVPGESGSALLTKEDGHFRIVGVLVGLLVLSPKEEGVVDAVAVPSSTFAATAEKALRGCPVRCQTSRLPGT